ncbi:C45 family autoproteolytic acyltransferase/hydolase [Streptomyces apricus]|uniref:Acyl-coenzyme A--6-aminopenicillanic acid acyl-transferase n=1 Tax=Streptomyces apricus TaxID=1828112 RepID=A0A5B0BHQ8_9ACTN|nr:C45 family peptidase [Streptomyces apricus]KAA0940509.1 acyl-coenzyme A--6-aminopenicillanic acid acyl-transferase [Streptomyces apricus]
MRQQHKTFQAIEVGDGSDGRWAAHARSLWQEMEGLLTEEGRTPQGADRLRALFRAHMPELVSVLDRLADQLDRPQAEAFLTHAALRPFSPACTQIGQNGTLLRNYDLRPEQCEGTIVSSCFLRPVIGMQDMLWGLLDGMNDAGLAISLTWGGRSAYGRGFAILILVRYLLETCDTVDEAVDRLRSLPVAVPQNLTLVDPVKAMTVFVGPDMSPTVAPDACAANHQHLPVTDEQEQALRTQERLRAIRGAGADVAAMLKPPLYRPADQQGSRTLYTAHYRPIEGRVTYYWPDESWQQSFGHFTSGSRTVTLGRAD